MGHEAIQATVGVITAIIGLAIFSVLVSKNANTMGVVSSLAGGLAGDIKAATAPVTSGGFGVMPTSSSFGGFSGFGTSPTYA